MNKKQKRIGWIIIIPVAGFLITWSIATKFIFAIVASVFFLGIFAAYAWDPKYIDDVAEDETPQRSIITIPITIALIVLVVTIAALALFVR